MNIGDIGEDLEAVDFAHARFTEAVEGPCMEDYASDEEAYQRLGEALRQLREAADRLLRRLPTDPAAALGSLPPQDIVGYRVEPDDDGEWHILTFGDGVQRRIFTRHPLVIVQPEAH